MADQKIHNVLTEPKGEHWAVVRELMLREDNEQCKRWKDKIQNLPIVSVLFSAIVTAFIVLIQIATGQSFVDPAIDPMSIWVFAFWFLSLSFSLMTGITGIVLLQWIHIRASYLRDLGDGPDSLGLAYLHSLAFRRSYLPLVFDSLPIILIVSVAFFLIGIIPLLFKLSWLVAIPLTCAITSTFAFLTMKTVHPALQPSLE